MKRKPATVSIKRKAVRTGRTRSTTKAAPEESAPVGREKPGKTRFKSAESAEPKKVEIPSILLEGDKSPPASVSGPGQKYSVGPEPGPQPFESGEAELPEAYGTRQLFLTARDPHWLYAHWDLTHDQQARCNARSADGHLVLRIYSRKIEGHPINEIQVHPESRHWFVHVERAADSYAAELGYYSALGKWVHVGTSAATLTPPDSVSSEAGAEFATIPFEFPFAKLIELVKAAVHEHLPLAQALEELRRQGHFDLPRAGSKPSAWTPQQEQALAKIVNIDDVRRVWMGSLEITELIRRRLLHEMSSLGASHFGIAGVSSISSLSSPYGGARQQKGFWFNVNAELIIYGATEPTARVTLGGHEIKLRPDGSFSYRFALPDGQYDLPAVAVSADGTEARAAGLKFSRATEYLGDVGAHPQDPSLKAPLPENV